MMTGDGDLAKWKGIELQRNMKSTFSLFSKLSISIVVSHGSLFSLLPWTLARCYMKAEY